MDQSFIELRFFRDITDDQRNSILKAIGILPDHFDRPVQHGIQRMLLKRAFNDGLACKIGPAIDRMVG